MAFIRYKPRGKRWYVYEVSNIWDKDRKKYYQTSLYLGVAEQKGGDYIPSQPKSTIKQERAIVDFGDGFVLYQTLVNTGISEIIRSVFEEDEETIEALIAYQITQGGAMQHCSDWLEGNVLSKLLPKAKVSSQNISKVMNKLGDEAILQKFFRAYIEHFFKDKHGILIDSTAMPNAINSSLTSCGYSPTGIQEMINCLMLVDKSSKMPIYFRAIAGEIADVSTLNLTIDEIERLGLNIDQAIFDAGYYSEKNIIYLCNKEINFITRLPKSRRIFHELIADTSEIEQAKNVVVYGKRVVFIESRMIELYGYKLYAHIIFDASKKAGDTNKLFLEREENPNEARDYERELRESGYFILISKDNIAKTEVMPSYYLRQGVEQSFGFVKHNMSLLPLRVHSDRSVNGYLLLVFLSLALFIQIREKLNGKWTVEQALHILRCNKAKIYDKELLPLEPRKKDKDIYSMLNITVHTMHGI